MRKWWPLVAICLGTFMLLVDVTIVNVALPDMAVDLKTSLSDLEWVVDIYALALAALLLGVGSTADRLGRRAVYLGGLVAFTAASLVCAVAPDVAVLITARAVQGLGAAGMFGTTLALLGMHYAGRERGVAFAVWGATNAIAAASGPLIGGLLTEYLDWRWIFFVNLPIAVVTVFLTLRVVREERVPVQHGVDVLGVLTFTAASGALTYALIRAHTNGWTDTFTLELFGVAAVALPAFVVVERRHRHPILDLRLFRRASFTGIMASTLFMQAGAFAYLLFTSLWLQTVLGYGPVKAGLVLMPMSGAAFVAATAVARVGMLSPRLAMGTGMVLIAGGTALQATLDAGSSGGAIIAGLTVAGFGVGLCSPSLSAAALNSVPAERGGMAGGAANTFRQLGYALGIAVFGVVFQGRLEHALAGRVADPEGAASVLSSGRAGELVGRAPGARRAQLGYEIHHAFATALNVTELVAAGVAAVGAVLAFATVRAAEQPPASKGGSAPQAVGKEDAAASAA